MLRPWLVFIIGSAVGIQLRKRAVVLDQPSAEKIRGESRVRPKLLLTPRELWASGFDARKHSDNIASSTGETYFLWTQETVDAFRTMYDETMNPVLCNLNDEDNVVLATKPGWGLTSRIRDFQDILIGNALNGKLVLHANGGERCPAEDEDASDPFLRCIFEPFSRCQAESSFDSDTSGAERMEAVEVDPGQFIQPVVEILRDSGLVQYGNEGDQLMDYRYLGVLRSLLQTTAFKFSSSVEERVLQLETKLGDFAGPMLIVHVRRTDKATDAGGGRMQSWFQYNGDDDSRMQGLEAILRLVEFAEIKSEINYKSLYLIADDPRFFETTFVSAFQDATARNATVLYNPYISETFGEDHEWMEHGHGKVSTAVHKSLDIELAADMSFAIKYGTHVVGCGRSGISQFIAQGLGAKYMADPNTLSVFEDDSLLLEHVMGKTQAEKHVHYLSTLISMHNSRDALNRTLP